MSDLTGILMAIAVAGGLLTVGLRNILHAIFGLAITLLALAGLFFVLQTPFVGTMEVVIYVGGISVAMIFAVMLSNVVPRHAAESPLRRGLAAALALAFAVGVGSVLLTADLAPGPPVAPDAWAVGRVGQALLDHYNLVFETLSVILLMAIVAAITISRPDRAVQAGADEQAGAAATASPTTATREGRP